MVDKNRYFKNVWDLFKKKHLNFFLVDQNFFFSFFKILVFLKNYLANFHKNFFLKSGVFRHPLLCFNPTPVSTAFKNCVREVFDPIFCFLEFFYSPKLPNQV